MCDRITKREVERQLNIQKRKDTNNSLKAGNEKLDFFQGIFLDKESEIRQFISQSHAVPSADLPDHFNAISQDILTLQKYVAASNIFLRNYDIQRCKEVLQELSLDAKAMENKLLPKKKFGFKTKVKAAKQEISQAKIEDTVDSGLITKTTKETKKEKLCDFAGKSGEKLVMTSEQTYKKDIFIENLHDCIVFLYGCPSTLHLNKLSNCKVFSGPVSTSIFAENCVDCTLVIACQQLRLHGSKNVHIYLHVTSRAIMEDCSDILLAPYNWNYNGVEIDFEKATLDRRVNNWRCVDDFNWLNIHKASPNWRELEEDERVLVWDT